MNILNVKDMKKVLKLSTAALMGAVMVSTSGYSQAMKHTCKDDLREQPASEVCDKETLIQKMDQKQNLIQRIRKICEDTLQGFKEYGSIGLCNLRGRAYFVDICNASNADEIFSYRASHWLLDGCRDGLESRPMSDYGVNPEFSKYHITTEEIFGLKHLLQDSTGKGEKSVWQVPDEAYNNYSFNAIYTILKDNPDFTPEFTTFTFGGTMADMPPLRDKDGNPNMDFFRVWQDRTEQFFSNSKK